MACVLEETWRQIAVFDVCFGFVSWKASIETEWLCVLTFQIKMHLLQLCSIEMLNPYLIKWLEWRCVIVPMLVLSSMVKISCGCDHQHCVCFLCLMKAGATEVTSFLLISSSPSVVFPLFCCYFVPAPEPSQNQHDGSPAGQRDKIVSVPLIFSHCGLRVFYLVEVWQPGKKNTWAAQLIKVDSSEKFFMCNHIKNINVSRV